MTLVHVRCPSCGELDIAPHTVTVTVCKNAAQLSRLWFTCPECLTCIEQAATLRVQDLLKAAPGVQWSEWRAIPEALEPHSGPPISHDDILTFALADLQDALRELGAA